jgi:hypothetical protein
MPLTVVAIIAAATLSGPAEGAPSQKKAIWGPVDAFSAYEDLGAGIFQDTLAWRAVADTRPLDARNPADPAYRWPSELDRAIASAQSRGMRVSLLLTTSPGWANGNRDRRWAPRKVRDFADFAVAASRRYPAVHHWMIWGEPSKAGRFQPLQEAMGHRLTRGQKAGPRKYARMLDATYAALKGQNRRNTVIGGNTWSGGEVVPLNFLKAMRLPDGRRPRMDLYGHNPFTMRIPRLSGGPIAYGWADFSELDALTRWLDRLGYRNSRGRKLRLFLSEFSLPTDHANYEFPIWVDQEIQALWISSALRVARRWNRIYTFGYLGLYDDPPRSDGLEVNRGLIERSGRKKPSYRAFKRG